MMFSNLAISAFSFLVDEWRFEVKDLDERSVSFVRGDVFVCAFLSRLTEISLRVGLLSRGLSNGFSLGVLVALSSREKGFGMRDEFAVHPGQIAKALDSKAALLKEHGGRIAQGDLTVFAEMQKVVEQRWTEQMDAQTRCRAEAAFAAKDYAKALGHLRVLGDRASPIDLKRKSICERNLL